VIYELHPATFAGNLDGVLAKLDELCDIGVNVIELMPVAEFAGDQSWGYNPALPYAVESPSTVKVTCRAFSPFGVGVSVGRPPRPWWS
jgi:1,4-alpha-glucan branching enzyme